LNDRAVVERVCIGWREKRGSAVLKKRLEFVAIQAKAYLPVDPFSPARGTKSWRSKAKKGGAQGEIKRREEVSINQPTNWKLEDQSAISVDVRSETGLRQGRLGEKWRTEGRGKIMGNDPASGRNKSFRHLL